jgi:hypothetical protein
VALGACLNVEAKAKFSETTGEGDKAETKEVEKSAMDIFTAFLNALPVVVKFGESGKATPSDKEGDKSDKPADTVIDEMIRAEQKKDKKIGYAEALRSILADPANADLASRYAKGE